MALVIQKALYAIRNLSKDSEYKIKGSGASLTTTLPDTDQDSTRPYPASTMAPVKNVHDGNVLNGSEKSTPLALVPDTVQTPNSESTQHIDLFMKKFAQYTQSVVDIALTQGRHQDIARDERRQTKERSRWSKYHSSFVAIGEDQSRVLKATIKEKDELGERLSQAKESGEQAMRTIATAILTTVSNNHVPFVQDVNTEYHGDEIVSIKNEIKSLRNSNVDLKSRYHTLVEEQDLQVKRQERRDKEQERQQKDISDLWGDSIRKHPYRDFEDKVERRFEDQSARIKALVEKAEGVNQDQAALQIQELKKASKSLDSRLQILKEKTSQDSSRLEVESTKSRQNISSLQKFQAETESAVGQIKESSALTTDANASMRNDISIHKDSLATVERDVEQLKQQLGAQVARSIKADEGRVDDLLQIKDVRKICEDSRPATESPRQVVHKLGNEHESLDQVVTANEQLRTAQESLVARLNAVEQICQQKSLGGSGSMDLPTAELIPRSLTSPTVQQFEKRVTDLQADLQEVYIDFDRRNKQTEIRDETAAREVDLCFNRVIKLEKDKATLRNDLDSKTQLLNELGSTLQALGNRVAREHSVQSTSIAEMQEDVRCLKEVKQSFEGERDQLRSQISDQRALIDTIAREQSQHSTSIELVRSDAKDEVMNPKLEALESDFRLHKGKVMHKVNAVEEILSTQQDRWNNLTTEPMIQAVVYRVQQIPPLWNIKTTLDGHQSKIMTIEGYLSRFAFEANQKHDDVMSKIHATQTNVKAAEEKFKSRLAIAMQSGKHVEALQPSSSELEQTVANLQHISSDFDLLRSELFALKEERSAFEAYRAKTLKDKQRMESEIQALQTSMSRSQEARAGMQGHIDAIQDRYSGLRDEMRQGLAKVPDESNLKKELQEELRDELEKDFYPVHELTRERLEKVEGLVAESNRRVEKIEGLAAESDRRVEKMEGLATELAKDMKIGLARVDSLEETGSREENEAARTKTKEAMDRSIQAMWVTVKKELVEVDERFRNVEEKIAAVHPPNAASDDDDDEDEPEVEVEDTQDRFVDADESRNLEPPPPSSSARGSSGCRDGHQRLGAARKSKKRPRYGISDDEGNYTEGSSSPPIRSATSSRRQRTARARGVKKIKTDEEPAGEDGVGLETPSPRR
ncbi:MAG: hypothetical protein Q9212_005848, partial [Teloschistes hypoglaucus]